MPNFNTDEYKIMLEYSILHIVVNNYIFSRSHTNVQEVLVNKYKDVLNKAYQNHEELLSTEEAKSLIKSVIEILQRHHNINPLIEQIAELNALEISQQTAQIKADMRVAELETEVSNLRQKIAELDSVEGHDNFLVIPTVRGGAFI